MKRMFIPAALGSLLILAACSKGTAPLASAEKAAPSPMEDKLDRLIQPKVPDPAEVSLEEAVEYLRVKTREVDTDDSFVKGVNFLIIRGGEAKSSPAQKRKLSQVPLREALRDIAEQHGMKYRVDKYAVVITPKDSVPPAPMPTEASVATEAEKQLLQHLAHRIRPTAAFRTLT